jgi:hypothetical protein
MCQGRSGRRRWERKGRSNGTAHGPGVRLLHRPASAYEKRLDELAKRHYRGKDGWLRRLMERKVITEREYGRLVAFIDWDNA